VVGELLVLTAFENDKLYTIAYRRVDGREAWRAHAPAEKIEKYLKGEGSPAASTCCTDGRRIVSFFGSCGLFCYDLAGKELWKFPLSTSSMSGDFGTGVSPILADGTVILVRDVLKDSRIYAIDAQTGSLKWDKPRTSTTSYGTPVIWETSTGKQVAAVGHMRMIGYDLKTGDEKWSVVGTPTGCCTSPVVTDGTLYFAGWSPTGNEPEFKMPTYDQILAQGDADKDGILAKAESEKTFLKGFFDSWDSDKDGKITRDEWNAILKYMAEGKNQAFALKAGGAGDITDTHVLWKKTKGLPYIASVLAYRGQLVMVKDGGIVTVYDVKTGEEVYTGRAGGTGSYYASPIAANGHIYLCSLQDGTITVIKGGAKHLEIVAKNPKLDERLSATPAIAGNTLYVRTDKHLWAFEAK
jgi:outer membrane protein assembly factor BamB